MYDNAAFPAPLEEEIFAQWLEQGRNDNIGYRFMLVVWDTYDLAYRPIYVEDFDALRAFARYGDTPEREAMVAAYDLYSESKVA